MSEHGRPAAQCPTAWSSDVQKSSWTSAAGGRRWVIRIAAVSSAVGVPRGAQAATPAVAGVGRPAVAVVLTSTPDPQPLPPRNTQPASSPFPIAKCNGVEPRRSPERTLHGLVSYLAQE